MRGAFYFIDKNKDIEEYLEKVFKAYWTEGKDISSDACLNEIVTSLSIKADDFLEFIALPETKERLVKNTQELMDRKGFGSPTFFLEKEDMYFGNDRIQLIEKNYRIYSFSFFFAISAMLFGILFEHGLLNFL